MNLKVKTMTSLFTSILLIIPIYIILHEGGHALIAVLCGAQITKFSILGAYMSYEGGTFSQAALSLLNATGMLIPVLVSVIYMLSYREKQISIPYRIFSFIFSLIPIASVLAWVIVPILYLSDKAPINDDVTKFIKNSELSPWVVLLAAIIILVFCVFVAYKKKIINNYCATIKLKE